MRTLLAAALMLAAASAWADWVKVTATPDTVFYVDPATISTAGNLRRVSLIQDYAKPEPGNIRSRRLLFEIDCTNERLRSLSGTEHAEPMAGGNAVSSWERESDWVYVGPRTGTNIPSRTPNRIIVRYVCSR